MSGWKTFKVWKTEPTNAPRAEWVRKEWSRLSPHEQQAVAWLADRRRKQSLSGGLFEGRFGNREREEERAVDPADPLSRQVDIILGNAELFQTALADYYYAHGQDGASNGNYVSRGEFYGQGRPGKRTVRSL